MQTIEEIELQLSDIAFWEAREKRKADRKEQKRRDAAERRRREKEAEFHENTIDKAAYRLERRRIAAKELRRKSPDIDKINNMKSAVRSLAKRLQCIPNDFICRQCGKKKCASKQWVVDLVLKTAICRVCHECNKKVE